VQQTIHVKYRLQHPHGIGSAAEAEQEKAVTLVVGIYKEAIRIANIRKQPCAEGQAAKPAPRSVQPSARVGRPHRANPGVIVDGLPFACHQTGEQLYHVGVLRPVFVAGAVAADHHVLRHFQVAYTQYG
jgi:hypothetical protein